MAGPSSLGEHFNSVARLQLGRQGTGLRAVSGCHPLIYGCQVVHARGKVRLWKAASQKLRQLDAELCRRQMQSPGSLVWRHVTRVDTEADTGASGVHWRCTRFHQPATGALKVLRIPKGPFGAGPTSPSVDSTSPSASKHRRRACLAHSAGCVWRNAAATSMARGKPFGVRRRSLSGKRTGGCMMPSEWPTLRGYRGAVGDLCCNGRPKKTLIDAQSAHQLPHHDGGAMAIGRHHFGCTSDADAPHVRPKRLANAKTL